MSTNYKTLALARDIEQAFKNHLNAESFPTSEWPRVALALAHAVEATEFENTDEPQLMRVQLLVRRLAELNTAISDLVGL